MGLLGTKRTITIEPARHTEENEANICELLATAGDVAGGGGEENPIKDISSDPPQKTLRARITKYGATGNLTASGKTPQVGFVAVSDRSIPFGTKIIVEGRIYSVEDRTAMWVGEKHGFTVDIFSEETEQEMLNWGARELEIIIK